MHAYAVPGAALAAAGAFASGLLSSGIILVATRIDLPVQGHAEAIWFAAGPSAAAAIVSSALCVTALFSTQRRGPLLNAALTSVTVSLAWLTFIVVLCGLLAFLAAGAAGKATS